ncbi:MAG: aminopeptidase P family N-terminal domain-containing protein, partial [Actinomycetota bacterium]
MAGALPPIDHGARLTALLERVADDRIETLLVTDLVDVRWLTGFTGSNAWAVVRAGELTLGTDGRYLERARQETSGSGATVVAEQLAPDLHRRLLDACAGSVSVTVDPASFSHARALELAADLPIALAAS